MNETIKTHSDSLYRNVQILIFCLIELYIGSTNQNGKGRISWYSPCSGMTLDVART